MIRACFLSVLFAVQLLLSAESPAQSIKGTFAIKNVRTGMLLRPLDANNKNATPLVSYSPVNWKCMTWDFKQVSGQTYYLRNLLTGKTFEPASGNITEGIALQQQPLQETSVSQQWEFIPAENTSFLIRLKGTDLYVTQSNEGSVNSNIILARKKPDNSQYWTIYEQHPTM